MALVILVLGTVMQRHGTDAEGCRDAEVVRVGLGPLIFFSMGTFLYPVCKVFVEMAARNFISNFAKLFYGDDSNNVWHLVMALV